jgi:hypothetical protein
MKYSLWKLDHESIYTVIAYKIKDTNSEKEVDNWIDKSYSNVASFYREETELNASYLQTI